MNWNELKNQLDQQPEMLADLFDREVILPTLLGKETADLSYWLGKQLARQFPFGNWDDLAKFFAAINWGHLDIVQQKPKQMIIHLTGPVINHRLQLKKRIGFGIEAGFLAQSIQQQTNFLTEATFNIFKKNDGVEFLLISDLHDQLEEPKVNFLTF